MTALTKNYYPLYHLRLAITKKADSVIEALIPRRCMVVSVSLLMAGLSIPLLMYLGLLPLTWVFSLLGWGLTVLGGILSLTLYGEI